MDKAFLSKTQNSGATKGSTDEFDYLRILNSCVESKHHQVKKKKPNKLDKQSRLHSRQHFLKDKELFWKKEKVSNPKEKWAKLYES